VYLFDTSFILCVKFNMYMCVNNAHSSCDGFSTVGDFSCDTAVSLQILIARIAIILLLFYTIFHFAVDFWYA